jgi:hypothetical protein
VSHCRCWPSGALAACRSTPPFSVAPNSLMMWKSRTNAASRVLKVL